MYVYRTEIPEEQTVPSVIVFITFPFKVRPWHSVITGAEPVEDPTALALLRRYFEKGIKVDKRPHVVLVTHNVREMDCTNEYIQNIMHIVPQNYIHFLLLSEHTKVAGWKRYKQTLRDTIMIAQGDLLEIEPSKVEALLPDPPATDYFFPIMPMRFIDAISLSEDDDQTFKYSSLRPPVRWQSVGLSFAIQGSFGGKSAFRRNLSHVIDCFSMLESSGEVSAALHRLGPPSSPSASSLSPSPTPSRSRSRSPAAALRAKSVNGTVRMTNYHIYSIYCTLHL